MHLEELIDDDARLKRLAEALSGSRLAAIDTEFIRESTYYPRLCVLQVATDEVAACVDCLAPIDLGPLFASLGRDDCTWLLHSGRQDLEVLWQHAGVRPGTLIDTQIAAALTGYAAQIGLQEMLSAALAIDIGKDFTRTDWSRRPLPDGALRYALDDVRYLLPLWRHLEQKLAAQGRIEWLGEDCRRLIDESEGGGALAVWGRIKGVQALRPEGQAAALALVEWREKTAQTLDRPRRWILSDELIARLAQQQPRSLGELDGVPEMPKRLVAKHGGALLAAVESAADPELAARLRAAGSGERPDKDALKTLQAEVKRRAAELGIEPEVLASRRDLIGYLTGNPPAHLRTGWRAAELQLELPPGEDG